MSKPGLSIESAASVTIRKTIRDHFRIFSYVIGKDHAAGKSTHAEYVNGLAAVIALMIAGGQGSKDDILNATAAKLRECVERDLQHIRRS